MITDLHSFILPNSVNEWILFTIYCKIEKTRSLFIDGKKETGDILFRQADIVRLPTNFGQVIEEPDLVPDVIVTIGREEVYKVF